MKKFVEWLMRNGFDIRRGSRDDAGIYAHRYEPEAYIEFKDTDEEQPELLVWCLKELERRGLHWHLAHLEDNNYQLLAVNQFSSRSSANGSGPTMTQAAMAAVTGEPTP